MFRSWFSSLTQFIVIVLKDILLCMKSLFKFNEKSMQEDEQS